MKKGLVILSGLLTGLFILSGLLSIINLSSCSQVETKTEYPVVLIDEMNLDNVMVIPTYRNGKVESLDVYFRQEHTIVINGVRYDLIKLVEDKDCFYIYSIENTHHIVKSNSTLEVKVNEYRIAKDGSWKYLVETIYLDWIAPEETTTPENSGTYKDGEVLFVAHN